MSAPGRCRCPSATPGPFDARPARASRPLPLPGRALSLPKPPLAVSLSLSLVQGRTRVVGLSSASDPRPKRSPSLPPPSPPLRRPPPPRRVSLSPALARCFSRRASSALFALFAFRSRCLLPLLRSAPPPSPSVLHRSGNLAREARQLWRLETTLGALSCGKVCGKVGFVMEIQRRAPIERAGRAMLLRPPARLHGKQPIC